VRKNKTRVGKKYFFQKVGKFGKIDFLRKEKKIFFLSLFCTHHKFTKAPLVKFCLVFRGLIGFGFFTPTSFCSQVSLSSFFSSSVSSFFCIKKASSC